MAVVIVDTGCANLASVSFAYDRLGIPNTITKNKDIIQKAGRVILPGVGSAAYAMRSLQERDLVTVLQTLAVPILGICLGMQLLFERSAEGNVQGLGLLSGDVTRLNTGSYPSPHMGWNVLEDIQPCQLLEGISNDDYVYFVHSYAAHTSPDTLAASTHGQQFSAVVGKNNIYGCQFHPERSGKTGAKILENFARMGA